MESGFGIRWVVPLLVIQGDDDAVVPPAVAARLVARWTAVNDLFEDGLLNNSLNLMDETETAPSVPGQAFVHAYLPCCSGGRSLFESYLVEGMGHAWPGPVADSLYMDHAGPDAAAVAWGFAKRYPMS
jgi:poly(3-hydroxybutyrate) depolymerase